MKQTIKTSTKAFPLKYINIKGEGRDCSMPGEEASMNFTASLVMPEDCPEHKALMADLVKSWEEYKTEEKSAKGKLVCAAVKQETEVKDKNDIDPDTEEPRRTPTGNVIVTMRTATTWPDGNPKVVKLFANAKDASGQVYAKDITEAYEEYPWTVGNESTGLLHGLAVGNTIGGKAKISVYLTAVQLAKLVKYTGSEVETVEMDGAEVTDLDGDDDSFDNAPEKPSKEVEV